MRFKGIGDGWPYFLKPYFLYILIPLFPELLELHLQYEKLVLICVNSWLTVS